MIKIATKTKQKSNKLAEVRETLLNLESPEFVAFIQEIIEKYQIKNQSKNQTLKDLMKQAEFVEVEDVEKQFQVLEENGLM